MPYCLSKASQNVFYVLPSDQTSLWPPCMVYITVIIAHHKFVTFLGTSRVEIKVKRLVWLLSGNLRRLHHSKKIHWKIIVIGQIIGSRKIDLFRSIESIIKSDNRLITILNWMDWLKHRIGNIFSLQKKFPKKICNRKLIIVIRSEGQIDALPWIAEGYYLVICNHQFLAMTYIDFLKLLL